MKPERLDISITFTQNMEAKGIDITCRLLEHWAEKVFKINTVY